MKKQLDNDFVIHAFGAICSEQLLSNSDSGVKSPTFWAILSWINLLGYMKFG
jgi:hypothetical protein